MPYVISGLPEDSVREDLDSLYSSSPVVMYPPLGYFSRPLEGSEIFTPSSPWSITASPAFEPYPIDFTFGDFRHVFNTTLGISQFVGTLVTDYSWPKVSSDVLGLSGQEGFLPYFLIMQDGMQSSRTKSFCLSVSNYLASRSVHFLLQPTNMGSVLENYSPEVENVFA